MQTKLPCIHGLRAIAILFVLVSHAQFTLSHPLPEWVYLIFIRADLGVFIFFILSGFLITYLLTSEYAASGTVNLRNFYLRRVLRIFPAFYSYLLVLAGLAAFGIIPIALSHFIDAFFFLWNYKHLWDPTNGPGIWYLGHFWTLSLEEQFYLLWPLTLLLLKLRRAAWVALALIIIMPVVRLVTYFVFPESRGQLMMMLHTGADALMFGCLLALLIRHEKMNRLLEQLKKPFWPVAAALFACIGSPLTAACLPGHVEGGYSNTLGRSLTGLSVTFIIAWLLKYPDCAVGRFLNSRPMLHIGVLSYSLYLWQQLFLTPLNKTWTGEFPVNLGCAYVAALLCYYLVERPFLKLKQNFAFGR
ncbi:MAG: acyltransferase [Verrucomicrobiae bacterium]|nr:acyltransferase [Verrucomicrobiae bacterium]